MTTPVPVRPGGDAPQGRAEVKAAVLAAAADLFATRGPAATSIREIAAASNVNHGLVYRHFGTKEKLVGAVLDRLGAAVTELLAAGASAEEVEMAAARHSRVVARAILDGYPAGQLQSRFPNVAMLLERVRPYYDDDREARLAVANATALQLGWRLFEPFLRSALAIEDLPETEVRASVVAGMVRLAQPD